MLNLAYTFILLWLASLASLFFFLYDKTQIPGTDALFVSLSFMGLIAFPLVFLCIYIYLLSKQKKKAGSSLG